MQFCVVMATHVEAPSEQQAIDHVAMRSPAGSVVVSAERIDQGQQEERHG